MAKIEITFDGVKLTEVPAAAITYESTPAPITVGAVDRAVQCRNPSDHSPRTIALDLIDLLGHYDALSVAQYNMKIGRPRARRYWAAVESVIALDWGDSFECWIVGQP